MRYYDQDTGEYTNGSGDFSEKDAETRDDYDEKYRSMTWWEAGFLIIAETVSLGVLSLPSVLAGIGIVPGLILIVGLGILATYTGYVFGQFKLAYPQVNSVADVGYILLGPIGREVFAVVQIIYLIFIAASHILTFTIAFNTITDNATCTIVWSVVALVVFILCTLPRTLKQISWIAAAAFVSLLAAVLITMIALGVGSSGPAPIAVTQSVAFYSGMGATAQIVFAYSGHVTFFTIMSEYKDPREFAKSLYMLQITATTIYALAAGVIYAYAGDGVSSPALGSTSSVVSKVAYGIGLVTIVGAGVVIAHVNSKSVYVRIFQRNPSIMAERSILSIGTWVAIVVVNLVISWVIAESIPVFNDLLSLIASLFGSWFSYGLGGILWLYMNKGRYFRGPRKILLTFINVTIIGIGAAIMGLGLYASGTAINEDVAASGGGGSWSCSGHS